MTYHLRPAFSAEHYSEIFKLDRRCFATDDPVKLAGGTFWLLWHEGRPVGYTGLRLAARDPGVAVRERSCVMPEHRGNGLQRRMIRIGQRWARDVGLDCMLATTAAWNSQSANNFIRTGWLVYDPAYRWMEKGTIYWKWFSSWPMRPHSVRVRN